MNSTDFYQITTVDGIREFDFLNNSLAEFRTDYPVSYHKVTTADLMRPDLISWQYYQNVEFWWIICYVNRIMNPLKEIVPGAILIIPSIYDIFNFRKKWLVSRT